MNDEQESCLKSSEVLAATYDKEWFFSIGVVTYETLREEKDTCLGSQINQINPGDQRGNRCYSQIALPYKSHFFQTFCF